MRSVRVAFGLILTLIFTYAAAPVKAEIDQDSSAGLKHDLIYFVMPDRYRNGDLSNDDLFGYNPSHTAFFHGGDLKGLTGNCQDDDGLARLKKLGFTAIWLTPLVVQQPPTNDGAGYHGYWGVDFLNVDPHLGSNQDLLLLSECARKLNIKLILDVVTNHTGDIIQYQDKTAYIPEKFKSLKNPAWLNELSNYHNVGDMNNCWSDTSCMKDGDFYGLDDLATENREVYSGWAEVYGSWIKKFGFAGFRVDTARHLDDLFFKNWSPLIQEQAREAGIKGFTIFGEVWEQSPTDLMRYVRVNKLQTALDFPFQRVAVEYASASSDASTLRNLFEYDDYYTDTESSAQNLVTFLGNHDMGRAAFLINSKKINPENQLLRRVKIAHSLLYLSRGIPAVYYGDEVGMTGSRSGNDQLARQDMFPTKVLEWQSEKRVGSPSVGNGDSFQFKAHPLSEYLSALAEIRRKYPALANGHMQIRYAKGPIFAFSKREDNSSREFVVAINNSSKSQSFIIPTATRANWIKIFGAGTWKSSNSDVAINLPPLETIVLRAQKDITETKVQIKALSARQDFLSGFHSIKAPLVTRDLVKTEFFIQEEKSWRSLGVDFSAPFTYYINPEEVSGKITVKAKTTDSKGRVYEFKPITFSVTSS
jgi:glycosidase